MSKKITLKRWPGPGIGYIFILYRADIPDMYMHTGKK